MRKELQDEVAKVIIETASAYAVSPQVRKLHNIIQKLQDELEWQDQEMDTLKKVRELVNPYNSPMPTAGAGLWAPPPAPVPTVGPVTDEEGMSPGSCPRHLLQ
jgi:hypothetical protein